MRHDWFSSLIGLACGNSYGLHYEFAFDSKAGLLKRQISKKIERLVSDDDSEMAYIALTHAIRHQQIVPDVLFGAYRLWARDDGSGIGIHTSEVLLGNKQDKNSEGNGSLMRLLPYALYLFFLSHDRTWVKQQMRLEAATTHDAPMVHRINAFFLDLALDGEKALDSHRDLLDEIKDDRSDTAWVRNSLNVVLDVLRLQPNRPTEEGFERLVQLGGDTDTHCAIYGSLMGAWRKNRDEIDPAKYLSAGWLERLSDLEARGFGDGPVN